MTKNEIVLMGKIYLIFNPSQFLWDTSENIYEINLGLWMGTGLKYGWPDHFLQYGQ